MSCDLLVVSVFLLKAPNELKKKKKNQEEPREKAKGTKLWAEVCLCLLHTANIAGMIIMSTDDDELDRHYSTHHLLPCAYKELERSTLSLSIPQRDISCARMFFPLTFNYGQRYQNASPTMVFGLDCLTL